MSTAAISTETAVNPSTQNPKQPQQKQTAKEAIAANVQTLIEQLEQGHSEVRRKDGAEARSEGIEEERVRSAHKMARLFPP